MTPKLQTASRQPAIPRWLRQVVLAIREYFKPSLKCARIGHDIRTAETKRFEYPSKGWRGVADEVRYKYEYCNRRGCCHEQLKEETSRETINSLSMSSERWDTLKKRGWA